MVQCILNNFRNLIDIKDYKFHDFGDLDLHIIQYKEVESNYAKIKQRWLIIESQARKESYLQKIDQKIAKEYQLISRKLASLSKKELETEIEAKLRLKTIISKLKYHEIYQQEITDKLVKNKQVRYQINAIIQQNSREIARLERKAGRFIIATNKLDSSSFYSDNILEKYKEQQAPERGFRFLKDPLFFADSVFLKTSQRIETMAMLMG